MAGVQIIVTEDHIPNLLDTLQAKLNAALYEVGERIYDTAYDLVPVRTGNLQRSLFVEQDEATGEVVVGAAADYAEYVELGTSKMAAQPYLTPAYEAHRNEVEGLVWKAIGGGFADLGSGPLGSE